MKLSVIIVNYNVRYYLEQCILSLQRAAEGIDADIWVVDNHSKDGSVQFLRRRFPSVNIISSSHNLGFARANNIAIRQSEGDYVLLLNPDTIVAETTLREAVAFMDSHPRAGGLGCRMSHIDGSDALESRRGLPTPLTSFYKMSGLCARFPRHPKLGHYYMSGMPWDKPGRIEVISGAFCMLRRTALGQVGLLDEDFFMYGEDIDLSYRLLQGGWENWYIPSRILHYKGESTQKSSFRYVHVFYEAMLIFFRKHYGGMSTLLAIPIKSAILAKASVALVKMQFGRARQSLGFFDKRRMEPKFVFVGGGKCLNDCRRIARDNGLDATFVPGTEKTLPQGHLDQTLGKSRYCVVYDIHSYSFEAILRIFASRPAANVVVGTYNPKTHTIITPEEIIR